MIQTTKNAPIWDIWWQQGDQIPVWSRKLLDPKSSTVLKLASCNKGSYLPLPLRKETCPLPASVGGNLVNSLSSEGPKYHYSFEKNTSMYTTLATSALPACLLATGCRLVLFLSSRSFRGWTGNRFLLGISVSLRMPVRSLDVDSETLHVRQFERLEKEVFCSLRETSKRNGSEEFTQTWDISGSSWIHTKLSKYFQLKTKR